MTKGTTAQGKRTKKTHIMCRRCGHRSYHATKRVCAKCGFNKTAKRRGYKWMKLR